MSESEYVDGRKIKVEDEDLSIDMIKQTILRSQQSATVMK